MGPLRADPVRQGRIGAGSVYDPRVNDERGRLDDGVGRLWIERLTALQRAIRETLRDSMLEQAAGDWVGRASRVERDEAGDTIFGVDVDAERLLVEHAERWALDEPFVLVAEGLEPATGRVFGAPRAEACRLTVIVDPIDGTRGLMFDKRSAWSLGAVAVGEPGRQLQLGDVAVAVMTELPTSKQGAVDVLWTRRGKGTSGERLRYHGAIHEPLHPRPSRRADLRHGFASVVNFFQGGKELTARIDEAIVAEVLGGWNHGKAEVYTDQYISSGGQLAELVLGRDRFVLDVRPLVHEALGHHGTLGARPYDVCTALIAQEAGCVVETPFGEPLDPPLDTTTNVAFAGYASTGLADNMRGVVESVLRRELAAGGA